MSHDLSQPLHDLVAEVPAYVPANAEAAWAAGARRRHRGRLGGAAAGIILVALVAAVVGVPHSVVAPAGDPGGDVDGYPARLDHAYWVRDLPSRSGPVAGLVEQEQGWRAVSPNGALHSLPDGAPSDYFPAVSDDGRRIGRLTTEGYEIHDVVTGQVARFPEVGDGSFSGDQDHDTDHRFYLSTQTPSSWSADGSALFLPGGRTAPAGRSRGLVLTPDGGLRDVTLPGRASAFVAGWTPAGHLAWFSWRRRGQAGNPGAEVRIARVDGEVLRTVELRGIGPVSDLDQWSGRLSPDGHRLAVINDSLGGEARVRTFDLTTGRRLGVTAPVAGVEHVCPVSWWRGRAALPIYAGWETDGRVAVTLASASGATVVAASPRLRLRCSVWASGALAGQEHRGVSAVLFGDSHQWLASWWRESALLAALALGAAALRVVRRRRRPPLSG